jgi:hypothetical protein
MADDKESKDLLEQLDELKDRAARKAAGAAAKKTVSRVANGLLDELEEILLGKKGAAEEILEREKAVDPLERIRDQYDLDEDDEATPPRETERERRMHAKQERRDRALEELARLKQGRPAAPEPAPAGEPEAQRDADDEPATKPRRRL